MSIAPGIIEVGRGFVVVEGMTCKRDQRKGQIWSIQGTAKYGGASSACQRGVRSEDEDLALKEEIRRDHMKQWL